MSLWTYTTKRKALINGVHIEKGMTVEVVSPTTANLITSQQGRDLIADAFMRKYGIDMKKANFLSASNLDGMMVSR